MALLPEVEPRAYDRGPQRRQFVLERGLDRGGETAGRLHHDVDHEDTAVEPQLAGLPVQIGDGLLDVFDGARPHAAPCVEDPRTWGRADAGLARSLPYLVGHG